MTFRQVKEKISSYLLLLLLGALKCLLQVLPLSMAVALGRLLGTVGKLIFEKERWISKVQVCFVQSKTSDESLKNRCPDSIVDALFRHIGQCVAEVFVVRKFLKCSSRNGEQLEFKYFTSTGRELVTKMIEDGTGAVALSGHIGSIELLAAYHARCGANIAVIGRTPNYPTLAGVLHNVRQAYGVEALWRNDKGSLKKLLTALKGGQIIAALIDQDTKLENEFSSFFGMDAASPIAPIRLAIRYNLPIFTSFIVRVGNLQHHVITEALPYDTKDPEAEQKILEEYTERLEKLVCQYPEQWVWWHRRWRRRPEIDYSINPELLPSTRVYLEWLEKQ